MFPGVNYTNLSRPCSTVSAILIQSNEPITGSLFIQNPSETANISVGLAGEVVAINGAGIQLPPMGEITIPLSRVPLNAITAVSDTANTPVTIYSIPGNK